MTPSHPILVFGTGNVGGPWGGPATTVEGLPDMVDALGRLGVKRIDTAALYPGGGKPGDSERIIAASGVVSHPAGFQIDTKVDWPIGQPEGTLSAEKVNASAIKSLENLGTDQVNVLYAHWPDPATPLEEQVEAFEEQRRKGRCREVGLSNFSPQMVEDWVAICKRKGYAVPAVYQGQYNLAYRHEEATLFPVLRRHSIAFFAWSPLASGFLSGRLTAGAVEASSRFADQGAIGGMLRAALDRPELHAAVRALQPLLEAHGISHAAAALRWVAFHSVLRADLGDGLVLGASRVEQMEQNVAAVADGPLPADVVRGIEDIWANVSTGHMVLGADEVEAVAKASKAKSK
ncbi:hypothetical protein RB595_000463 [Gaeumannomyces hyphopodioides]